MAWIKLHDRITEWQWFGKPEMVQMMVYFLIKAARYDTAYRGLPLKRGQLVTSIRALSKKLGLSFQTTRTCLNRLRATGEIRMASTQKITIITICKYDNYQYREPQEQHTSNTQPTHKSTHVTTQESTQSEAKSKCCTTDRCENFPTTDNTLSNTAINTPLEQKSTLIILKSAPL